MKHNGKRAEVTTGSMLRELRHLHGITQKQLAAKCGIGQADISALENGSKNVGIERAKRLAIALKVHPSVIAFPNW